MTPERFCRIQTLFSAAVELDVHERSAWLREQCGDDSELFDAVQELLSYDQTRTLVVDHSAALITTRRNESTVRNRSLTLFEALSPKTLMFVGALAALVPLLISGAVIRSVLDGYRAEMRATSLVNLVNAKSAAITAWLTREQQISQSWADNEEVRRLVLELNQQVSTAAMNDLEQREVILATQQRLKDELQMLAGQPIRFAVWNRSLLTIADWSGNAAVLATGVTPDGAKRLTEVFDEGSSVAVIGPQERITTQYQSMPTKPMIAVFVRVTDTSGQPMAVMMVASPRIEEELSDFIHLTRGDGVSIAQDAGVFIFNQAGMLLMDSPYDSQLKKLGLLPDQPDAYSAKTLVLRDPGRKLNFGTKPPEPRAALPLTKMAGLAVTGQSGFDVTGYRDVRGVIVEGAWKWLDDFKLGIGIEIERNTIHPSWWVAKVESLAIIGLLGLSLGLAIFAWMTIRKLNRELEQLQRIGPYVLEKEVGRGGMGRVFKARHDLLKRPTAIKVLHDELVDERSIARFKREAQLVARLEHPNTVMVYDFGVNQRQQFYLVMEWIEGETLDARVRRAGPLDVELTVHVLGQITASLQEAHSLGLIHRDLKPQNVMLTERAGESNFVKVLDFGLARELAPAATDSSRTSLTGEGWIAGTPRYMSPERWNPLAEPTTAIDWFALGCLGFLMLTGREAISGNTVAEIAKNATDAMPAQPSLHGTQSVPPWLDDLIMRCTQADPAKRIQTAEEVFSYLKQASTLS